MLKRIRNLEYQNKELRESLVELKAIRGSTSSLTQQERQEIASRWAQVVFSFCGGYHHGFCNRVKKVEMDELGRPRVTEFWEKWEQNPQTIWPEDVWSSPSQMTQEIEEQSRKVDTAAEITRIAKREADRVKKESERTESPREIVARVTRGE